VKIMGWLRNVVFGDRIHQPCGRIESACICHVERGAIQNRAAAHRLPSGSTPGRNQVAARKRYRKSR
jgi:hypothetical protein